MYKRTDSLNRSRQHYRGEYALHAAEMRKARKATAQPQLSQEQTDAFKKSMQRDGRKSLTAQECELLASNPNLTVGQRLEWAELAKTR